MIDNPTITEARLARLQSEIENFVATVRGIHLADHRAQVGSVEIAGRSRFLHGTAGGDHIIYVDFDRRYDLEKRADRARKAGQEHVAKALLENRDRVGVLLADATGHRVTDALLTAMLHQAFLTGLLYELDSNGTVTPRLFENLNSRFYNSVSINRSITLIYGEVWSNGTFRFLSAGHPKPLIFSAQYDRFVDIPEDRFASCYPLGMFPSKVDIDAGKTSTFSVAVKDRFSVNELNLMGAGDILLLFTDGLTDLARNGTPYSESRFGQRIQELKNESASDILNGILEDAVAWAEPDDDISLIVIKRG